MASVTIGVGSYGAWQGVVEQVGQSQSGNYSNVRVRGIMKNNGQGTSWGSASKSISGTNSWSGSGSFNVGAGASLTFIDQTFRVYHNSDGTRKVAYVITLGATGTTTFGNGGSVSVSLSLTRISERPSAPGKPSFSNALPTSVTVSWAASSNNGGSSIDYYLLRYWPNKDGTGSYIDHSKANNRSRTVTGLTPGQYYKFVVYAHNGSSDNDGYSDRSSANVIQMLAGAWLKISGAWKLAVPYINVAGVWKLAVPYIKSGGVWKMTS